MSETTDKTDELLSRHKREITERLEELAPLINEFNLLSAALNALEGNSQPPKRRGRPPKHPQS